MPRRLTLLLGWLGAALIVAAVVLYVRQYRSPREAGTPTGQTTPVGPPVDEAAALPFDKAIVTGALPNGLKYFVRRNVQPPRRAELRLVVNAGSLLEDDDQRGLAHIVEHMAFNGTASFPKREIGAFLESIGMRFGPNINATTGFDETTYALQIPTDDPAVLERALVILEEWAHRVTFDAAEVEKERGVILEEWRLRRGAGARLQDAQFPVLLAGSRYADRMPIGTPESIRTFTRDRLRQFYRDWYRPDLMAVVAVGDVDAAAVAAAIEARFSRIPAASSPRPRPVFDVPPIAGTSVAIATDAEAPVSTVSLAHRRAPAESLTAGDYRRDIVQRLALGMMSTRLSDVSQLPNGPFSSASAGKARLVRGAEIATLSAVVGPSGLMPALSALSIERERLMRFGFTAPELERQKSNLLKGFERAIAERERQPSAALAAEYIRHFTIGEPVPGLDWEFDITSRLLPAISIDETSNAARAIFGADDRIISISAPKKTNVYVPAERELLAVVAAAKSASLQPWVTRVDTAPLLESLPTPGTVARTVTHEAIGVTEWHLANGVRVVVKPTDFSEDQVVFTALRPGGLSLAADADLVPAQTAVQVVSSMGFGRFGSGDLRRALAGKAVAVQPAIGPFEEGLSGGASRADLETMFQVIHLTMTSPRRDAKIFGALTTQLRTAMANQAASPDFAFSEALTIALSQNHPRAQPMRPQTIDGMDMDRSLAFYRSRFGDANGFTFVLVGNVTLDTLRPLVERYLASLPSTDTRHAWKDLGVRPPRGVVVREVARGLEPKSRTALVFTGRMRVDRPASVALVAMAEVLQTRLRDAIREDLGGTYQITAGGTASVVPMGQFTVTIDFTGDPARMEALTSRVLAEIGRLRTGGPTAAEVADVQARLLRDFESSSRQNAFIAGQLAQRYQSNEPPASVWQLPDLIRALSGATIHELARLCLDTDNYVRVTLKPGT